MIQAKPSTRRAPGRIAVGSTGIAALFLLVSILVNSVHGADGAGTAAKAAPAAPLPWRAGVAVRKITPPGPIWLAGYANRAAPSAGLDTELFAKALALDDTRGGRLVLVTLDLIGIPAALRAHAEQAVADRFGLRPHELLLNASHTHSGPQVAPDRMALELVFSQKARPVDVAAVEAYEPFLRRTVVELVGEALAAAAPARLDHSQARAGFAMNRRRPEPNGTYSNNPYPAGPVDHDVPVLRVADAAGQVRAVLFGYACHNTVLGGSAVSGDYAGHAQRALETSFPGAAALFLTGCGGDQNPYPRGAALPDQKPEDLAAAHGRTLALAVATALGTRLRPVAGPLRAAFGRTPLPYTPPTEADLAAFNPRQHTPPVLARAQALRDALRRGESPAPYPYPVQVVHFGTDLVLVALAGEVVVDYSLRLKRELAGPAAVWVAGYCNDVFGYLGSRRVITEGGYEGGGANTRILNHPGNFSPEVEDLVIGQVHALRRTLAP